MARSLRIYRKLEARGEICGGRFVAGFSGEQFALPEPWEGCAPSGGRRRPVPWYRCLARTLLTSREF
jgi:hypothetical protein